MKQYFSRIVVTGLFIFLSTIVSAQQVSFEINAPSIVEANEIFRVEYTTNARADSFDVPVFGENFEVIAGPTVSERNHVSIVNGNFTQSAIYSYIYALRCSQPGTYTIPEAAITVDGKTYSSKTTPVEIAEGRSTQSDNRQPSASAGTVDAEDLFIRLSVDKTNVFKGEPVKVSAKIYTRVPMGIENIKFPAFNGFWVQEITKENFRWQKETYNGKVYETGVIKEWLIFPQQTGAINIDAVEINALIQIVTAPKRQSLFDEFFGGGPDIQEVKKKLSSAPAKISVKELPAGAPLNFSGAVGNFSMNVNPPSSEVTANSSANYSVTISGNGNLPLIQAPKLALPSSFEQYDVKTTESLKTSSQGISGTKQFDYPFIARAEGDFSIEPVEFTYFDPAQVRYITISSGEFNISVLTDYSGSPSAQNMGMISGAASQENVKLLNQDIRFIKLGKTDFTPKGSFFLFSGKYFFILGGFLIIFIFSIIFIRKHIAQMKNSTLRRVKRANKVALYRFRLAEKYMKEDNPRGFYEETLKALWGYLSDKLNIPVSNLTKENVRESLSRKGISAEFVQKYIDIISDCEYAQYAPSVAGRMKETYSLALDLISKLEPELNR